MEGEYDFVVIGAGSAGNAAAREAEKLGLRTAVLEGGAEVGGLCILRGCMPSKTLLESANRYHEIGRAAEFGLSAGEAPRFNVRQVIARKRRLVAEFSDERQLGRLDGDPEHSDDRLKMAVVFTEPEVATLGLTEEEAREAGHDFAAACHPFAEHGRAIVEGETAGMVKLIAERGSGSLLGAAAVGVRAAELINEMMAVMYYHGTAQDIVAMPHYHPTLSEIWTYPAEELSKD